ncbi:hypothetical protein Tco_1302119 [Tanacetum coccineum]
MKTREGLTSSLSGLPTTFLERPRLPNPRHWYESIELANELMDLGTLHSPTRKRQSETKGGCCIHRNNHNHQQQPFKRQNVARVYNMGTGERKPYGGSLPKCNKCYPQPTMARAPQEVPQVQQVGHFFARRLQEFWSTQNVANTLEGQWGQTPKKEWLDEGKLRLGNPDAKSSYLERGGGNESSNGRESRLTVISSSKAQEYMAKGCQVFLAQISAKKEEDKSERKQIEDVPIVRDFPEVFPEDLPGLPPASTSVDLNRLNSKSRFPASSASYRLGPNQNEGIRG